MQHGRDCAPFLLRVSVQLLRGLRTLASACRLRRCARQSLVGIALEQAEMLMFRRRTGHQSLPQRQQFTTVLVR
jgi:hypothetical protein